VAACGGESTGASEPQSGSASSATPSPVSIEIAENDDGFVPRSVTVERGQLVHVTFANRGTVIHNLRIAGPNGQFGGAGDFILGQPVVAPGESATGDWQAPAQAGSRPFRCDAHPAHTGLITIK
jgi:plastocyanin